MSNNFQITVLGTNGRRTIVKAHLDTSILQIIEDACAKQKLDAHLYNIKHLKRVLDHSSTIRYSNIPKNALLELVEARTPRIESLITVNLATDTGQHLIADFHSSSSMWDILLYYVSNENFEIPSENSCLQPVISYGLRRIIADQLKLTSLKSLGLLSGKCLLRYNTQSLSTNGSVSGIIPHTGHSLKQETVSIETAVNPSLCIETNSNSLESLKTETCNKVQKLENENSVLPDLNTNLEVVEPINNLELEKEIACKIDVDDGIKPDLTEPAISCCQLESDNHGLGISDEPMDTTVLSNSNMQNAAEEASELPGFSNEINRPTIIKLGDHDAILFNFDDAPPTLVSEESDSFYDLSVNEVKKLYQEHVQQLQELDEMPLMTKKLREFQRDERLLNAMKNHPVTQLRICFPDRNVLQANFKPRSTVREVMNFIQPFLANPNIQFHLYSVFPKQILKPDISLVEANCIPKARLYFGCEENLQVYLNDETLQKKSSFEGATKEIVQTKASAFFSGEGFRLDSAQNVQSSHRSSSQSQNKIQNTDKKPKWFKLGK